MAARNSSTIDRPRVAGKRSASRPKARWRAAPRLARTLASLCEPPVAPFHRRAVMASKLDLPARSATCSPAMMSSPRSPSTWLNAVSAAGTPSRPIWLLVSWMFMAGSPCPLGKVKPLDSLINLDYVNQYEKIRRPLFVRPRGFRRARDFAGHALRLCQPRADSLRTFAGFTQPSLSRGGYPGLEGAPRAVAGAARLQELRSGPAGDGFGDCHHHRGRPDLSWRQLRRSRAKRHARTCRHVIVGCDPD